ncbi:hypothetical protein A3K78_01995 [Candidatus Bathyarchaeota archaeon RBG_13_52_12]|nr:MAG: hypothetical protein A3K78_01995 [Candidatus Bathyarchaeota archaeon RBG_13_52_12]
MKEEGLIMRKDKLLKLLASISFLLFALVIFYILMDEALEGVGFDWLAFLSGVVMLGVFLFIIQDARAPPRKF